VHFPIYRRWLAKCHLYDGSLGWHKFYGSSLFPYAWPTLYQMQSRLLCNKLLRLESHPLTNCSREQLFCQCLLILMDMLTHQSSIDLTGVARIERRNLYLLVLYKPRIKNMNSFSFCGQD
jgi:hypothetical protein